MLNHLRIFGLSAAVLVFASISSAQPFETRGTVQSVTVYRGQALVTRTIVLPAGEGEMEVVVTDLPIAVVGSSLSAGAPESEGVIIRSVRFRSEAVAEAVNEEVAKLDEQIEALKHKIFANQQQLELVARQNAYLDQMQQFVAPTVNVEMAKGVLDVETLARITDMNFKARKELTDRFVELNAQALQLTKELDLLQRKRAELAGDPRQAKRQAVLFVSKNAPGDAALQLNYLVTNATWTPTYNIRLNDGGHVALEYLAEVQQMSGEDWSNVALTLSTATPSLNARDPLLTPLWVELGTGPANQAASDIIDNAYLASKQALAREQRAANLQFNVADNTRDQQGQVAWQLNRLAAQAQQAELIADPTSVRTSRWELRAMEEGLAVSYTLEGGMNLASRSDRQLVQIARLELPADTYYEAIPLLTNYVYQLADVTNTSDLPLLNGQYSAYVGQEFVGRGQLPIVARGQNVVVGFGIDTQLRCSRELTEKADEISWGQRVQTFHYQLRLENFKDTPVTVRLYDRIPASKTDDIKIDLGKPSLVLSTDEVYLRDDKPKGLLRWDVQLPPAATGAAAHDVTYDFQMKFAKDKQIGQEANPAMEEMEIEFGKRLERW